MVLKTDHNYLDHELCPILFGMELWFEYVEPEIIRISYFDQKLTSYKLSVSTVLFKEHLDDRDSEEFTLALAMSVVTLEEQMAEFLKQVDATRLWLKPFVLEGFVPRIDPNHSMLMIHQEFWKV